MTKAYIAENWSSGVELADGYLTCFINQYRTKDSVSIFLLGHAIELYVKSLYLKYYGDPSKNTYNIKSILEKLLFMIHWGKEF